MPRFAGVCRLRGGRSRQPVGHGWEARGAGRIRPHRADGGDRASADPSRRPHRARASPARARGGGSTSRRPTSLRRSTSRRSRTGRIRARSIPGDENWDAHHHYREYEAVELRRIHRGIRRQRRSVLLLRLAGMRTAARCRRTAAAIWCTSRGARLYNGRRSSENPALPEPCAADIRCVRKPFHALAPPPRRSLTLMPLDLPTAWSQQITRERAPSVRLVRIEPRPSLRCPRPQWEACAQRLADLDLPVRQAAFLSGNLPVLPHGLDGQAGAGRHRHPRMPVSSSGDMHF